MYPSPSWTLLKYRGTLQGPDSVLRGSGGGPKVRDSHLCRLGIPESPDPTKKIVQSKPDVVT